MFPEEQLSALQVPLVTNNTCVLVSVEQATNAVVVSAISQNVQRDAALALVVGLPNVFLLEKERKIVLAQPEDALVGKRRCLLVMAEQRRSDVEIRGSVVFHQLNFYN